MKQFDYAEEISHDVTLHQSLTEQIKTSKVGDSDYLEASFMQKFEGADVKEFGTQLRDFEPTLSDSELFKKDIQLVFDENYFNMLFLSLFHQQGTHSLA